MRKFEDVSEALDCLSDDRFVFYGGLIRCRVGVDETDDERAAISYLCAEWDYALDPERVEAYAKHVEYRFEIRGHEFAAMRIGKDSCGRPCVEIEETDKNGQEDCHQYDAAYIEDGVWKFESDGRSFDDYGDVSAQEILAYLTKHPLPGLGE